MADIDASGSDAGGKDAGSEMELTGQSKTILDMMKGLFKEFAQTTDAKIERLSQEVAARTKRERNESDSESGSDASVRSTECKKRRKTDSDPDVLVVQEDINLDETELAFLKRKAAEAEPNTSAKADASGLSKFAKVEQELSEPEKLGPKVSEDLAGLLNGRFTKDLGANAQKSIFEAHNRPENCPNLCAPRVNKSLWTLLSKQQKETDLSAQHIQRAIAKATTAVARVADEIEASQPGILNNLTDAICLLGHASLEFSYLRRKLIPPA
ncbi:hypothetical protein BaRGS_00029648 [Batillaria attramentaria]|uniref:Uncharacterized protein n=1 Tax=Batillaria attramentaria TaxID=370345 RepID=A0ABD0JWX0_9CAEN